MDQGVINEYQLPFPRGGDGGYCPILDRHVTPASGDAFKSAPRMARLQITEPMAFVRWRKHAVKVELRPTCPMWTSSRCSRTTRNAATDDTDCSFG
ncbi:hypothetical protein PC119_g7961 [Phytophthora cactorum]|nr:hypothetical protein PC119_g7961 [Phytophthora cactorum]KAG3176902.1 hypothetical protein C6341_g8733 [Phytophthora cactorum]